MISDAFAVICTLALCLALLDLIVVSFGGSGLSFPLLDVLFGEDSFLFATFKDPVEHANKIWRAHKNIPDTRENTRTERVTWEEDAVLCAYFNNSETPRDVSEAPDSPRKSKKPTHATPPLNAANAG
jgi:hypothetical protein